ncbi:MAG TPA: M4 family metallopeptidase [Myxococcales bacterium]|nr:M4 family metallopeptidase [Myxococcales bacterium]
MSSTQTIRSGGTQPVAQPPSTEPAAAPAAPAQGSAPAPADQFSTSGRSGAASPQLSGADRSQPVSTSIRIGEEIPMRQGTRVLSLSEPAAQDAIGKTADGINTQLGPRIGGRDASNAFVPRAVEKDELGMTHVRMDRTHNGVPVLGEQVIGHLDQQGKLSSLTGDVQSIPEELGKGEPAVSSQQAIDAAMKAYGQPSDTPPEASRVIVKTADGQYHDAYRVQTQNFQGVAPERMNYLVDAKSGQVLEGWNQMASFFDKGDIARMGGAGGARGVQASEAEGGQPVHIEKSEAPSAPIQDFQTTTSTIDVGDDATLDSLKLNVDIDHTWRGDLVATLTSPSGKSVTFSNREGGSQDNIKGTFDLSEAFKGEDTKGTWTLTVADKAGADQGTLNNWGLSIDGKTKGGPQPGGDGNDSTIYAGKVEVGGTDAGNGQQKLLDQTRGKGIEVRDANNRSSGSGSTEFVDNNGAWGEATDPARQKGAVDAMYGAQMTSDFYKDILGRNSIDGNGEKLLNNVHINTNYVNAFWDGTQMNYGDGNGRDAGSLTTLDIAGHEITHGLTQRTANLVYRGESGGINESMSDIMGAGVDWYAMKKNPELAKNGADPWKVGEQAWTPGTPGDALRYMDDPTKDNYSVDNYKNYPKQTEVHGSSGIMNNAFYLMVNGGTNKTSGLQVGGMAATDGFDGGMEKGLKIFGRALTTYMTPNTTFAQARQATIQAATDLYGADSDAVKQVMSAWTAVGVN